MPRAQNAGSDALGAGDGWTLTRGFQCTLASVNGEWVMSETGRCDSGTSVSFLDILEFYWVKGWKRSGEA